jgi:TatD DNase family protein
MRLVDTHAHLDDDRFRTDVKDAIARAIDAGVTQVITVGTDMPSSRSAVALAQRHGSVYATVGLHPHRAATYSQAVLGELRDLAAHPRVVAIGETGLDFYRDLSPRETQRDAFRAQLLLAMEANKPVVVHIRDRRGESQAHDEAIAILRRWVSELPESACAESMTRPGVVHCFSGEEREARDLLGLGFCLGIDGPVTYPNAKALQAMVTRLPLDSLLLETDCPYLSPQPQRGRRNEPAYLRYIATEVARLRGEEVQHVGQTTTENARRLFHLPVVLE